MSSWRVVAALLALLPVGCSTIRVTDPARTATEQFLIAQATRRAVAQLSTASLRDQNVFMDDSHIERLDKSFLIGELRAHLLSAGVRLAANADQADVVLEVRSAGLGIDRYESMAGIPPLLAPAGSASAAAAGTPTGTEGASLIVPELAITKNIKQYGFADVAYIAYRQDTGEVIAASGPFVGRTYRQDWWFFGFGPRISGDIPPVRPRGD